MIALAINWGRAAVAVIVPLAIYAGRAVVDHYSEKKRPKRRPARKRGKR